MAQPYIDQDSFHWRNDNGSETEATWIDNANDNLASPLQDSNYRLRFLLQNTGDKDLADGYRLEYNVDAAGWVIVTTTSSYVRSVGSINDGWTLTDEDATTQQLGTGTFDEGYWDDTGTTTSFTFAQTQESELEFCFQFRSTDISGGETIEIRVALDDGTELDLYTNTPSTTFLETPEPSVSESVTVSDTPAVAMADLLPSVSDSGTVADDPTVSVVDVGEPDREVSELESITVADSPTARPTLAESVSDGITVTDAPDPGIISLPGVSDSATVADAPQFYTDLVVVWDHVALTVVTPGAEPEIHETESVGVTDDAIVALAALRASVSESITTSDSAALAITNLTIAVADSTAVADTPDVSLVEEGAIAETESVMVSDSPALSLSVLSVAVQDSTTVADGVTVRVISFVAVVESVTVADSVAVALETLVLSASDGATVADSAAVLLLSLIHESEGVTAGDAPALALGDLQLTLTDSPTVADASTVYVVPYGLLTVQASETITVGDAPNTALVNLVAVAEAVMLSEVIWLAVLVAFKIDVVLSDAGMNGLALSDALVSGLTIGDALVGRISVSDKTRD